MKLLKRMDSDMSEIIKLNKEFELSDYQKKQYKDLVERQIYKYLVGNFEQVEIDNIRKLVFNSKFN